MAKKWHKHSRWGGPEWITAFSDGAFRSVLKALDAHMPGLANRRLHPDTGWMTDPAYAAMAREACRLRSEVMRERGALSLAAKYLNYSHRLQAWAYYNTGSCPLPEEYSGDPALPPARLAAGRDSTLAPPAHPRSLLGDKRGLHVAGGAFLRGRSDWRTT